MKIAHAAVDSRGAHAVGRALLAELYRSETGEEMPAIVLQERGKPCFPEGDRHFSITHTRHHVFCALSDRPVGIDAEELDRDISLRLAEKILSPGERAQFDGAPDKRRALLTFWVLKEATVKCTGEGLRGYPKDTGFSLDDPRVTETHGCLLAAVEDD